MEGPGAIAQVLLTSLARFCFHLVRRSSGGILLAMVPHGLWDFGRFTGKLGKDLYPGSAIFILVDIILGIVLLVRRHKIELDSATR